MLRHNIPAHSNANEDASSAFPSKFLPTFPVACICELAVTSYCSSLINELNGVKLMCSFYICIKSHDFTF